MKHRELNWDLGVVEDNVNTKNIDDLIKQAVKLKISIEDA